MTVLASTVTAGQQITEADTPEGPWYLVVEVNRRSLVLALDNEDPTRGTVRVPITDGHVVRARTV